MMMVNELIKNSRYFFTFNSIEKNQLITETVDNFNEYINPGFLKYRKSFSPDYVAVEWADHGSTFTCVKGIEYIDCLGGYGIYK